jgi:nickel transport protein
MGPKNTAMALVLALGAAFLCPGPVALAHGLFWNSGAAGDTLMVGHPASAGHGGQANHALSPDLISSAQVFLETWRELDLQELEHLIIPVDAHAARVQVDWGWWVKTYEGSRPAHPDSTTGVLQAWHTRETLLLLQDSQQPVPRASGEGLEIVPDSELDQARPGDKVTFMVLLEGEPVPDATVYHQGKIRGTTDSKGNIRLKLRHPGPQQVRAGLRQPVPDHPSREFIFNAQLDFNLESD